MIPSINLIFAVCGKTIRSYNLASSKTTRLLPVLVSRASSRFNRVNKPLEPRIMHLRFQTTPENLNAQTNNITT